METNNNSTRFKVAVARSGLRYWQISAAANELLPPEQKLSENAITRLATNRKVPTLEQAKAIAQVLDVTASDLFPKIGNGGAA